MTTWQRRRSSRLPLLLPLLWLACCGVNRVNAQTTVEPRDQSTPTTANDDQTTTSEAELEVNYVQLTRATTEGPGGDEKTESVLLTDPQEGTVEGITTERAVQVEETKEEAPITPIPKNETMDKVKPESAEKTSEEAVNDYDYPDKGGKNKKDDGGILQNVQNQDLPVLSDKEKKGAKKGKKGKGSKSKNKLTGKLKEIKPIGPLAPMDSMDNLSPLPSLR